MLIKQKVQLTDTVYNTASMYIASIYLLPFCLAATILVVFLKSMCCAYTKILEISNRFGKYSTL